MIQAQFAIELALPLTLVNKKHIPTKVLVVN
jgi:hypothetical protein